MFIALAGSELPLGTGRARAPAPPVPSDDFFLSPTFVQTLAVELAVGALFGPIMARPGFTPGTDGDAVLATASRSPGDTR